ncbi:MAG: hypothetical protein H0X70_02555 [Segetibacter sp.]|jgi:replication initiation and membrane attachment protein DnaB|nr:hypothetical protein [Segetibacter sp.]
MEPFELLTEFYETIADDARIGVTHISVYIALVKEWNSNKGRSPVLINRKGIMKTAKISSRHTYNKCINDLHQFGYIKYIPTSNALDSSQVYLNLL